jgi:hypothetical protein
MWHDKQKRSKVQFWNTAEIWKDWSNTLDSNMGGVCLSVCIHHTPTHTHTHTHTNRHTSFDISSTPPRLPACGHIRLCLTPKFLPFLNAQSKARHPKFSSSWCFTLFIFLSSSLLCFPILSQIYYRLFPKISYNISYEYVVTRKCMRCLVLHVTDTEPSVHLYWSDTASQSALQLPLKDGSISALIHINTGVTRYTEHTVDVRSNRT